MKIQLSSVKSLLWMRAVPPKLFVHSCWPLSPCSDRAISDDQLGMPGLQRTLHDPTFSQRETYAGLGAHKIHHPSDGEGMTPQQCAKQHIGQGPNHKDKVEAA